jgi:hypothetical protein
MLAGVALLPLVLRLRPRGVRRERADDVYARIERIRAERRRRR